MWAEQLKMEKLAGPEGDGQRPYINDNGLFIGPGVALVTRVREKTDRTTFVARPKSEIDHALTSAYGMLFDSTGRSGGLAKYSPDQPRDWHGRWAAGGPRFFAIAI